MLAPAAGQAGRRGARTHAGELRAHARRAEQPRSSRIQHARGGALGSRTHKDPDPRPPAAIDGEEDADERQHCERQRQHNDVCREREVETDREQLCHRHEREQRARLHLPPRAQGRGCRPCSHTLHNPSLCKMREALRGHAASLQSPKWPRTELLVSFLRFVLLEPGLCTGTTFWKRVRDFLLVCENRDPNGPEQGWGARKKAGGEKHERRPPQGRRCGAL